MATKYNACVEAVKAADNQDLHDICARHLYEMAATTLMCHLLMQNATKAPELFGKSLNVYINYAESEIEKHNNWVNRMNTEQLDNYRQ